MSLTIKDLTTPIPQVKKTESVLVVGAPARFTANPASTSTEGKVLQTAITGPSARHEEPLPKRADGASVARIPDHLVNWLPGSIG